MHTEIHRINIKQPGAREQLHQPQHRDQRRHAPAVGPHPPEVAHRVQLPRQHRPNHHTKAQPEAEQRDLRVALLPQDVQAPRGKIHLRHRAANPEQAGPAQHARQPGIAQEVPEVPEKLVHAPLQRHLPVNRGQRHARVQQDRRAKQPEEKAVARDHREPVNHFGPADEPHEDGHQRRNSHRAIRLHQPRMGHDLGQNAGFRRRIKTAADADNQVADPCQ